MKNKVYIKFLKIIISNLFFLSIIFNQSAYSKPIPPGSGEGDVPANILILLDSSLSMQAQVSDGVSINTPWDIVEDSDGDLIMTGTAKQGVIKIISDTEKKDPNFGFKGKFKGTKKDSNCDNKDSSMTEPRSLGISSNVKGHSGTEVIFATEMTDDNGKIVMFDTDGNCLDVIGWKELGNFRPMALTVRTIGSEDHLIAMGRWWKKTGRRSGYWKPYMYTRNLTEGVSRNCSINQPHFKNLIANIHSISMDNGNYLFIANPSTLGVDAFALTKTNDTYCPTDTNRDLRFNSKTSGNYIRPATSVEVDPDTPTVLWIASHLSDTVQKATFTAGTSTVTASVTKGSWGTGNTTSDADVNIINPTALHVTSDYVYAGVSNPAVLQFDNDATITWQDQLGGSPTTRFKGAQDAIKSIMSDSSITSGANFGYGYWNSGRGQKAKWCNTCRYTCHFTQKGWNAEMTKKKKKVKNGNKFCNYWDGWGEPKKGKFQPGMFGTHGTHPEGTSTLCNRNSCIEVAVHADGYLKIPDAVDHTVLAFGTDSNAFAKMADGYFRKTDIIDEDSDCQLNYVIVISDGAWTHGDETEPLIRSLRKDKGVKTLVVAYGGGIKTASLDRYERMALAGSCDNEGGLDCKEYINAETPQDLKTHLKSAIQQIIADKLSFTAPSITASIQEGGSLYQAQFNYRQYGEWQGTILRKGIDGNGKVCHDPDTEKCPGNWDAAEVLKSQANRNIWTVLPDDNSDEEAGATSTKASYIGDWNNWKEDNATQIKVLFDLLGSKVLDYHNASSQCKDQAGVANGTDDDVKGLINFLRGQDYFDYNGGCDITEKRDWEGASMLGDIYHSQIIEIGPPKGAFDFTRSNEEAYWRAKNNYQAFIREHYNRDNIIYAGANDGMLHAFRAETGEEAWAFIPPFIAGKLPTIINVGLDGKLPGTAVTEDNQDQKPDSDNKAGGTNAIFGVDGSPVVHDMYIRGLALDGKTWESNRSWRTVLIVPYGRGGAGFSVLDVTEPIVKEDLGPMHMFSVYNDQINSIVYVANAVGNITPYYYMPETIKWGNSREAMKAKENQESARQADVIRDDDLDTEVDAIYECHTNANASNDFANNGTNACFKGKSFTFNFSPPEDYTLKTTDFRYWDERGQLRGKTPQIVSYSDGVVTLTFPGEDRVINYSTSDQSSDDDVTSYMRIQVRPALAGVQDHDYVYNYSKLGETWSTPRVVRIPDPEGVNSGPDGDIYAFVMGGGMGSAVGKAGSNLFVVDLENRQFLGAIAGASANEGPIKIIDTRKTSDTPNGSDIANAIPSAPVVITPENVPGLTWRGAMVYVNDLEGKITKVNLTNLPETKLFQQRTIATLGATRANARLSYHSMDAAIGRDTKRFWLFGATGHYERLNDTTEYDNDNILYGIKDDLKSFTAGPPLENEVGHNAWLTKASSHAEEAPRITDLQVCKDVTGDGTGSNCPTSYDLGWVVYLNDMTSNTHRKSTATPRVYKGNVYFPIYEPYIGKDKCNLGKAYICANDDECGKNVSTSLATGNELPAGENCYYVADGILSELVVFGDTLFANVAGPSKTEETLVSILAGAGEVGTYRRSWREGF